MKNVLDINRQILAKTMADPKYAGKPVMVVGGQAHIIKKNTQEKEFTALFKKYPQETPMFAYVPGGNMLILLLQDENNLSV